jgi:hypothetical protein
MVEKPGFSAFGVVTNAFELARFLPVVFECGEWQSVQPTSLRQCSPRRKLFLSSLPAWQTRHVSDTSFGDLFLNEMIFVGSPLPSTWALPGPWHDSQPVILPFQLLSVVSEACAVCE